ncbi:MAG: hypothetical protein LBB94_04100, partial [Clostridiales bacterium]|nr:hypothetical protein [Clostridiales bacterium]
MYKKLKFFFIVVFVSFPALYGFAGGVKAPKLAVNTVLETSRLVSINWMGTQKPEKYRWGLYRFDLEEKTYTLVTELEPLQSSFLDENLEPPISKYFYKIEYSLKNEDLASTKPIRINRQEVAEQLSSSNRGPNDDTPENETPRPTTGATSGATSTKKPAQSGAAGSNEGIYVGIIGFSGKVTDITQNPDGSPALIPLDAPGQQTLLEYLARSYVPSKSDGTALYYADHKAIANLTAMEKNGVLPKKIDSVTVITFTDGTDTSSTDADFVPIEDRDFRRRGTSAAYRTYISQQLSSRRIAGVKINAWAIGVPGKDIQNNIEFSQTLEAVASDPENVAEFKFVSEMNGSLVDIADGLNIYTPKMNLMFSTPAYPLNTMLRLTFDSNSTDPDVSEYYVDARISWDEANKNYILTALDSYGIKLADKRRIEGKRTGTSIYYTLTLNNDFNEANVRQWYMQPGENSSYWIQNSEFTSYKTADFMYERKSALVYLVLDCSSSLTEKEVDNIREAIGAFITKLYEISSSKIKLESIEQGYPRKTQADTLAKAKSRIQNPQKNVAADIYIQDYNRQAAPPVQRAGAQVQQAAPPVQRVGPPVQQAVPQVQQAAPQAQRAVPQVQQA